MKVNSICRSMSTNADYAQVGEFEDGLPQLGALLNRDDSFGHYRAFFPEASRLLLRRMIKIGHLVEKLQELDAADAAHVDEFRLRTIQIGGENGKKRLKLEQQLDREIREYCMIKNNQAL